MAMFGEVSGHLAVERPERLVYMRTRILNVGAKPSMVGYTLPALGRGGLAAAGLGAALLLSACASSGVTVANADTEQLAPVQSGNVSTTALPPIGPNGEVQAQPSAPLDQTQVANAGPNGALPPLTAPNSTGRDLSGGLTVEKLLGRWTVVSGANQCAINLTQTQKTGTSRYRASAPACPLKGLTQVASWTVAGSQVQLFDESGNLIAALILSGNRFIGTLSGGTGISMVG
jgi:hypothetical protein